MNYGDGHKATEHTCQAIAMATGWIHASVIKDKHQIIIAPSLCYEMYSIISLLFLSRFVLWLLGVFGQWRQSKTKSTDCSCLEIMLLAEFEVGQKLNDTAFWFSFNSNHSTSERLKTSSTVEMSWIFFFFFFVFFAFGMSVPLDKGVPRPGD